MRTEDITITIRALSSTESTRLILASPATPLRLCEMPLPCIHNSVTANNVHLQRLLTTHICLFIFKRAFYSFN